jgi:tetratricopeptide (TPR) repeat protein
MMRFIKKILKGPEKAENAADSSAIMASEDLERIERELEKLGHGYEAARLLNRAGDLYLVKSDRERALKRYGEAIDAYLQSGEYDNAMAVCRKIIRVVPEVIRTRRTLAWLCLGKGFLEIAREHVEAYVQASKEAKLELLAVQHLLLMSQYVDRADFREFLAGQLTELGDERAADRVREGKARDGVRAAGWTPVVFAAMLTPDDLRHAADKGVEIKAPTDDVAANEVSITGFEALLFDPEAAAALEEAAAAREAVLEDDGNGIDAGPERPVDQESEVDEDKEGKDKQN